jgi:fatty acid-binding protein DegV
VRGGRISKFSGNMVSIFQLQVTVTLTDTELKKFGVDGSVKRAIKRVAIDCFSELKKRGKVKRIAIFTNSVCDPKYDYKKFRDLVMQELKTYIGGGIVIEEHKLPPFIIAHVGPNYVGLAMEVV